MSKATFDNAGFDTDSIQPGAVFVGLGGSFTITKREGDEITYLHKETGEWSTDVKSFVSAHRFLEKVK